VRTTVPPLTMAIRAAAMRTVTRWPARGDPRMMIVPARLMTPTALTVRSTSMASPAAMVWGGRAGGAGAGGGEAGQVTDTEP
jgi:hypothetical protein